MSGDGSSKCKALTSEESDALFFPGPGGKKNKAEAFCLGCPVRSQCLQDAIRYKLVGFWAGTTDDERRDMADFLDVVAVGLPMPPEPKRSKKTGKPVYRKVAVTVKVYEYLDQVEPNPMELMLLEYDLMRNIQVA